MIEQTDFLPQTVNLQREDPNTPRWVFFAGDVIGAQRKREMEYLRPGGTEIQARTLVHTRGFVRRGRFTPVTRWFEGEIAEHANKNGRHAKLEDVVPVTEGQENKGFFTRSSLLAVPRTPAGDIKHIVGENISGVRIGVNEVPALKGIEYADFPKTGYQELFFHKKYNTPDFPETLHGLVELIRTAPRGDRDFEEVRDLLLTAAEEFRTFGETYLEAQNTLVRKPPNETGFTYSYSATAETLFKQLNYERVDQHLNKQARQSGDIATAIEKIADLQAQMVQGRTYSEDESVVKMMQQQLEEQRKQLEANQKAMEALQQQLAQGVAVSNAKPQQQPVRR